MPAAATAREDREDDADEADCHGFGLLRRFGRMLRQRHSHPADPDDDAVGAMPFGQAGCYGRRRKRAAPRLVSCRLPNPS